MDATEVKTTGILWLDAAHDSIANIKAAEARADEERRAHKEQVRRDAMAAARAEFETSLDKILGEESAAQVKGSIEFDEKDVPFVRSGNYELGYCKPLPPRKGPFSDSQTEYRLHIRRPIPERLREVARWQYFFTDGNPVASSVGVARAVRAIEDDLAEAETRFAELELQRTREQRRAELDLEPRIDEPRAEPVMPKLSMQEQADVVMLEDIIIAIKNGCSLTPEQEITVAVLRYTSYGKQE